MFALMPASLAAPITLSNVLGDHMVLQRDAVSPPAMVWGFGDAGVVVKTSLGATVLSTTVGSDGVWRQPLPPTPASSTPVTILFNASDGSSASLSDVLFGDTFLCGGQSKCVHVFMCRAGASSEEDSSSQNLTLSPNPQPVVPLPRRSMQFTLTSGLNATQEIALADDYPLIRLFTVGQGTASNITLSSLASVEQPWVVASSASVGNNNWTYFSAVCWLFGRDVFDGLRDADPSSPVPIGLISNNWGGTPIAAWTSPDALAQCGPVPPGMQQEPDASDISDPPSPYANSTLWNAMIYPYTVGPMSLSGAIWYQAEADAPPYRDAPAWYACAFQVMIASWRASLANPRFWFGFVQLAPFIGPAGTGWADTRQAQLAALNLPYTAYATAVDSGDPQAPFGSYHPRNKQIVGSRLAAAALDTLYGVPTAWRGPEFAAASWESSGTAAGSTITVTVTFQPGSVPEGTGLVLRPASCPVDEGVPPSLCSDFALLVTPGTNPSPPSYSWMGTGYLAAGNDVFSGSMTVAQAEAACTSNSTCLGFTFASNDTLPTGAVDVYLKSALNFDQASGWQSYASTRDPRGVMLNATAAVGADGTTLVLTAVTTSDGQQPVAVSYAYSTWPVTPLYNGAGLPAIPFFANLTGSGLGQGRGEGSM
jgi:sialate O-acetylesterase